MSRSATELTRFTATAPHAYAYAKTYAKTSALRNVFSPAQSKNRQPQPHSLPSHRSPQFNASSSISHRNSTLSSPPPSSETPAEKVARLRAARFKARFAQIPLWDRVVVEGRIWADRAHRITVLFLLIASVLSILVAVVSLSDMIIYNRRKRRAWVKDQAQVYQQAVTDAIEAERSGQELNEEQRLILGRERVRFEEEEAAERRKKERWWITKWLLGGLKMGDEDGEEAIARAQMNSGDTGESGDQTPGVSTTEPEKQIAQSPILRAVQEQQPQLGELNTSSVQDSSSTPTTEQAQPKGSWWNRK